MNLHDFLLERNVNFDVIPHRETHDAQRMAATVHVSGHCVAKTVLLRARGGYTYVVAIVPADRSVDLEKASKMLGGGKLDLATEEDVARHCPDCELGALPPFGSQYDMKTIVDVALSGEEEIVFEGNTHHESIRMTFRDFRNIENPLIGELT